MQCTPFYYIAPRQLPKARLQPPAPPHAHPTTRIDVCRRSTNQQPTPQATSNKETGRTHAPHNTISSAASRNSLEVPQTQTTAWLLQPSSCAPQAPSYTTAACWLLLLASWLTAALLPACPPACRALLPANRAEGTPLATQFLCTLSDTHTGCLQIGCDSPEPQQPAC